MAQQMMKEANLDLQNGDISNGKSTHSSDAHHEPKHRAVQTGKVEDHRLLLEQEH